MHRRRGGSRGRCYCGNRSDAILYVRWFNPFLEAVGEGTTNERQPMTTEHFESGPPRHSVRTLVLPPRQRLLVLAPHPDDFDAIAVTLRFLADAGHDPAVCVVRTGSGVQDNYAPGAGPTAKADLREQEQRRSIRLFGLPDRSLTFLRLQNDVDEQPLDTPANRDVIAAVIARHAPDIVFMPHGNDTNRGHRVMDALFRAAVQQSPRSLCAWRNRDPKTVAMRIDLYMPFDQATADWKAQLLRFHDSQHQRNLASRGHGFDERILTVNREIARDLALAAPYAEAFEVETCAPRGCAGQNRREGL